MRNEGNDSLTQSSALNPQSSALTIYEGLALFAIVALAAALRLGWIGVNSFAFDEARLSLIALKMARGGAFASVGMPSSAGVPNLPGAAWLFALPYAISSDPLIATLFAGVVSLLTVIGVWALARRTWGAWAGLAAALFLAASPYAVLYSRNIWAQNLLPALGFLWLWTAYRSLGAKEHVRLIIAWHKSWLIALHVFIAGFAVQVHFAGAALALGTLYLFVRFRWWRHFIQVAVGAAAALVALVPFIVALTTIPALAEQFRTALSEPSHIDFAAWGELVRLALNQSWGYLALGDLDPHGASPLTAVGIGVVLVAGLAGVILPLTPHPPLPRKRGEGEQKPLSSERWGGVGEGAAHLSELTLVLLLTVPIFFTRHSAPVLIHYFLTTLPALALVAGASVTVFERTSEEKASSTAKTDTQKRVPTDYHDSVGTAFWLSATRDVGHALPLPGRVVWKIGVTMVLALVAAAWTGQLGDSLTRAGQVATPNGLGTPLGVTRAAAYGVETPVLFFTHGDDPDVDGEAAVFSVLWWGREHRIVQGESLLILPPYPATLMATLAPFQAWEELEASDLATNPQTFPRREGEGEPFIATRYNGTTAPAGFTALEPIRFADGTQLEGWRVRWVGPRLRVSTLWRVVEPPPPGTYQQFHHLYPSLPAGEEGTDAPLLVSDVPISAHDWQVGDRLIVMGDFFDVLPGEYWVDVGHYTLPDVARISRADGGDSVRLGAFEVESN